MIVTTFARPGYLQKAMDCEVHGYLLKDEPIDYLIETIRKVMNGEKVVSRDLAATLFMKEQNPLNEREIAVLQLVKEGFTTGEISKKIIFNKRNDSQLFINLYSETACRIQTASRSNCQ